MGSAVLAAKQATSAIPIVFSVAVDPLGSGLVANLAQPGGNVTGHTALCSGNAAAPTGTLRLRWITPSRGEDSGGLTALAEEPAVLMPAEEAGSEEDDTTKSVQGGRDRGLVIHKLFEEVLTGETTDDPSSLIRRAHELIRSMGREPEDALRGSGVPVLPDCKRVSSPQNTTCGRRTIC